MFEFFKEIQCVGLRYPKFFHFNGQNYLIGSKKYKQEHDITKYGIFLLELDVDLTLTTELGFIDFKNYPYLDDITQSGWVRDININKDKIYLNIEIKQNVNNQRFFHNNILISTNNLIHFDLIKIYNTHDFLYKELQFNNHNYTFTAKIEEDIEDIDFNWGKYLFVFLKDNEIIQPLFDNIVDYAQDKGHVIGNIFYNKNDEYNIYFSIRHKVDKSLDNSGFMYKIYTANTKDLIHYYDTREIKFVGENITSNWYSYPHYFTYKNEEYIVCNQDDYGKHLHPIIFKKQSKTLETIIAKLYNLQEQHNLQFTTKLNYIYYEELSNQSGKRFDHIKDSNLDINTYTNYAPSCKYLIDVMKELNINSNDKILDIGCGWGYALAIFNKFPFKTITGIEINKIDIEICKQNLNILKLKETNLINDNILNFKEWEKYNYFYFYNPFSEEIFKMVILNIPLGSIVIYKNIHDSEKIILLKNNFNFIFEHKGEERNYIIFRKN